MADSTTKPAVDSAAQEATAPPTTTTTTTGTAAIEAQVSAMSVADEGSSSAAPAGEEGEKGPSKAQLKRMAKAKAAEEKKAKKKAEADEKARLEREKRLVEADKIVVEMDPALPEATSIAIKDAKAYVGKRVIVSAWVQHLRRQGAQMIFLDLRDGSGFMQCVLQGNMCKTRSALSLYREASVKVWGTLKGDERAKGGVELQGDFWEMVGSSNAEIEARLNIEANPDTLADNRHIVIRGAATSTVLRLRSIITHCFREHFFKQDYVEVTPPSMVQTQCEGGSSLFSLKYFGEDAYLTQSSQLYLETVVPAVGKCFCIWPSFRAEKSRTRRHLAEYTHLEAEMGFLSFEDLLQAVEHLVVDVVKRSLEAAGEEILKLNPDAAVPETPFIRMTYADAVKWLDEHGIVKEDGSKYVYGEDIPEKPERMLVDAIGKPILLTEFPAGMKAFYMSRCEGDKTLTESVDLLMPGVGEIVGGSMRINDYDELIEGYKKAGISPDPYYWYTDQRLFGSVPHGGYGLGVERFLCWLLGRDHIRDVCLYPRVIGRCKP